MAQWDTTTDSSHTDVQMCQLKEEGGRRCSDGRRFMKETFATADLVPKASPGRPPVAWFSEPLDAVKKQQPKSFICAAFQTLERYRDAEPRVTSSIEQAAPAHARLAGLEYRMKSPDSICGKIDRKQQDAIDFGDEPPSPEEVTGRMKDVLRYTIISSHHKGLAEDTKNVAARLVGDGWKITEAENFFVSGNSYKGLHLTVTDSEGLSVEVQIHSEASIKAKEGSHPLYEEARDTGTSPARARELRGQMVALADELEPPDGLAEKTDLEGYEIREIKR